MLGAGFPSAKGLEGKHSCKQCKLATLQFSPHLKKRHSLQASYPFYGGATVTEPFLLRFDVGGSRLEEEGLLSALQGRMDYFDYARSLGHVVHWQKLLPHQRIDES